MDGDFISLVIGTLEGVIGLLGGSREGDFWTFREIWDCFDGMILDLASDSRTEGWGAFETFFGEDIIIKMLVFERNI